MRTPTEDTPDRPLQRPRLQSQPPPRITRRRGIRVATLNCQTLRADGHLDIPKLQELALACVTHKVDILAIQEHRVTHEEPTQHTFVAVNGTTWHLHHGSAHEHNNTIVGGVGILLSERCNAVMTNVTPITVSGHCRALAITLALPTHTIRCFSVYAPHSGAPQQERRAFLDTLGNHLDQKHNLILGDLNAVIRPSKARPWGFTAPLSDSTQEASEDLEDFLAEHDLTSLANMTRLPHHYTFTSPDQRRRTPIDHILTTSTLTPRSRFVVKSLHPPVPSDHRLLLGEIRTRCYKPQKRIAKPPAPDIRLLRTDEKVRTAFIEIINRHLESQPLTVSAFIEASQRALGSLPARPRVQDPSPLTHPDSQHARRQYEAAPINDMRRTFAALSNTKSIITDDMVETFCARFAIHANSDARYAYEAIRRICRKPQPSGRVTAETTQQRLDLIKRHCEKQLQNPLGLSHIRFPPRPNICHADYNTAPFTKDELQKALRKLDNHKAPGPDGIPNEVLKLPALESHLLALMNDCLAKGKIPADMKRTKLAMIPKAGGNLASPAGWRYIALMPTLSKLFDRLLLNRIAPVIAPHLRPQQNGFLAHRSTLQHALGLALILEDHRTRKGPPLFITYIDFSNAFPSITRASIRAALAAYHVPPALVDAIMAMYLEHETYVSTSEGDTETFLPTAGVLQGDTLAPFLFVIVLDLVLRQAIDGYQMTRPLPGGIHDLDFADDIALLASCQEDAQALLSRVHRYAERVGLALNIKKTMYQYIGEGPPPILQCNNVPLEHVTKYKYLGVYTDVDADISARTGQAWVALRSLKKVWRSQVITTPNKIQLFKTLILPILLYGSPTYPLTEGRKLRLQGTTTKMLRHIRGYHRLCHAPLATILQGCTHIVALAQERAVQLVNATRQYLPGHPLLAIMGITPAHRLRAGRYHLLRQQLQNLLDLSNMTAAQRLAHWEEELYNKAHQRRSTGILAANIQSALKRHVATTDNEDLPISELPQYKAQAIYSVRRRREYLESIGIRIADVDIPIVRPIAPPAAGTTLTFTLLTAQLEQQFWTAASCTEEPSCSSIVLTTERPGFDRNAATQHIINDCLRNYPACNLIFQHSPTHIAAPCPVAESQPSHPPATNDRHPQTPPPHITPLVTIAQRVPRKHILWDIRSHLIKARNAKKRTTTFKHVPRAQQLHHPDFCTGRMLLLSCMPKACQYIY